MSADELLADAERVADPPDAPQAAPLEHRAQGQAAPAPLRAQRAPRLPPCPRVRLPRACKEHAPPAAPTPSATADADAPAPEPPDAPPIDDPDAAAPLPAILRQQRGPDGPTRSYTDAGFVPLRALSAAEIARPTERVDPAAASLAPSPFPAILRRRPRPASPTDPSASSNARCVFLRAVSASAVQARAYAVRIAYEADLRQGQLTAHSYGPAPERLPRARCDQASQTDSWSTDAPPGTLVDRADPAASIRLQSSAVLAVHPCQRLPGADRSRRFAPTNRSPAHCARRLLRSAARELLHSPRASLQGGEGPFG
jgi:hypothetical protein